MRILIFSSLFSIIFINTHSIGLSKSTLHFICVKLYKVNLCFINEVCNKNILDSKSILKSGSDISLLSLNSHVLHQFKYFLLLFLFKTILCPETEQQRIEYYHPDHCQCINQNFLFFYTFFTVKFLNIFDLFLDVFVMNISLIDLVIE